MVRKHAPQLYEGTNAERLAMVPVTFAKLFYATDTQKLWWWDGTDWQEFGAGGGAGHDPVTVTDSATIDLTLVGQDIQADLINTAVTPGSYTNADITVDQQGRITLAADGAGGSFTPDFSIWMPDAKPTTPNALDDEFDDASFTGWTAFDPDGTYQLDEYAVGLRSTYINLVAAVMGGLYKTYTPSANMNIWTKVTALLTVDNECGIMLGQDLAGAPTTSDIITLGAQFTPGGDVTIALKLWTSYNDPAPTVLYTDTTQYHTPIYLSLDYADNGGSPLLYAGYSFDGIGFVIVGGVAAEYNAAFVPNQVGLFNYEVSDAEASIVTFSFFRKVDDIFPTMFKGSRVAMKFTT